MPNPKSGEFKPGANRPEVVDRWAKALRYREAGWAYDRIAKKLGYASASGAYAAVMDAMKATLREPAENVRAMELDRLDRLMKALWKSATRGVAPDMEATDRILKIMDRRARLLGLDKVSADEPSETRPRIIIPGSDA